MIKRTKVFIVLAVVVGAFIGCFVVGAQKTKAGGYSYLNKEGKIDIPAYFSSEGAKMQLQEKSLDFIMENETATVTFNKALLGGGFELAFAGIEGNTLERIDVQLTDVENPEEKATLSCYAMSDTSSIVQLYNTNRTTMISGSFYKENDYDFYVRYDSEGKQFTDDTTYTIPIIESLSGDIFPGFSSEKVNLTIQLYGKTGSVFRLKGLSRQRMGSLYTEDTESPSLVVINKITKAELNSIVMLPKAVAEDVLADKATVTMSVVDPDKEMVTAVDGTKLQDVPADKDYQVEITKLGRYRISYQATDGTNVSQQVYVQIAVVDSVAPTITLSQQISSLTKAGTILSLPEAVYQDDVSEATEIKSWVTLKYPDGVIMEAGKNVELVQEGLHEITYSAIDEAGNIGRHTVKLYVEGGEEDEK